MPLRTRTLAGGALAVAVAALTVPAYAHDHPAPTPPPTLELIGAGGSGCPAGTAQVTLSPDSTGFVASYKAFAISTPPDLATATCTLTFKTTVAPDHRLVVRRATYRGDAALAGDAQAEFKVRYSWRATGAHSDVVPFRHAGAFQDAWASTHDIPQPRVSACGQDQLLISQTMKLSGGGAHRFSVTGGEYGPTATELAVVPCTPGS